MLIEFISDLHGFLPELKGGDLLIIAGDLTARDKKEGYDKFFLWLSNQSHRCKIFIAGNHDGLIEKGKVLLEDDLKAQNIHYLCDSGMEFEGLKIWGSPYTPKFQSWHFMCNRGQEIKKHWDLVPADIDILVTHGPPYGILDTTIENIHAGCEELRAAVQERIKPKIHCFGHIHECGNTITKIDNTTYINCSYVDEDYRPLNSSVHLEALLPRLEIL